MDKHGIKDGYEAHVNWCLFSSLWKGQIIYTWTSMAIHGQTWHHWCKIWARQDSEWISTIVKTIVQTLLYYSFHNFFWVEWSGETTDSLHIWETGWEWRLLTYICRQCRCQFWWGLGSWQMVFSSVLGGEEISKRRFGKQVRGQRWGGVSQSAVQSNNNIPDYKTQ
jgi:hypothetical protein